MKKGRFLDNLNVVNNHFMTTIIIMLSDIKKNILTMNKNIENLNREETIKMNRVEILKPKTTVSKIKIFIMGMAVNRGKSQ